MPRAPRASVPPRARSRAAVTRARAPRASSRSIRVPVKKVATLPTVEIASEVPRELPQDPIEALIQKHAPARAVHARRRLPFGYGVAVFFVIALVVVSWWFTLDRNLGAQRHDPDPTDPGVADIIQNGMSQFQTPTSSPIPSTPSQTPDSLRSPSAFEQRLERAQNLTPPQNH